VTDAAIFPDSTVAKAQHPASKWRGRVEWVLVVGGAILIAVLLRAFVVQAFSIPSESMEPTLKKGDRVLVEKLTYHRRDPGRGDVIVFLNPDRDVPVGTGTPPPEHLIKRIIAVGGDAVVLENGQVDVNGVIADASFTMPGSKSYELNNKYRCARAAPCVIPPGHVWAMGDNREHSGDSRAFGPIATQDIVGRAFAVVWPLDRFGGL